MGDDDVAKNYTLEHAAFEEKSGISYLYKFQKKKVN